MDAEVMRAFVCLRDELERYGRVRVGARGPRLATFLPEPTTAAAISLVCI